jgi:hypothetical protein
LGNNQIQIQFAKLEIREKQRWSPRYSTPASGSSPTRYGGAGGLGRPPALLAKIHIPGKRPVQLEGLITEKP